MAVTSREVERLYVQVNKFALVSACDWEAAGEGGARRRDSGHIPVRVPSLVDDEAEPRSDVRPCVPVSHPGGHPHNAKMPCSPYPIKSRFSPS